VLNGEFTRDMYLHMDLHPAHKFRVVHELIFEDGNLQEAFDRSQEMANFRKVMIGDTDVSQRQLSKQ